VSIFLKELMRRNVHKVAIGYLTVGWLLTEILGTALAAFQALLADLDTELARQRAELEAEGLMEFHQ